MFRRIEATLQPDPTFPADLKQLGFFINTLGQICMIDAPEKNYVYHATNNERTNEMRREAMQTCQRDETEKRLSALGIGRIYLPSFSLNKPGGPHVPILAPPPEILKKRKRVIVLVNDTLQDPGVLAYRQLQRELGINGGSVVNFVKELIKQSDINNTANQDNAIFKDGYELKDDAETPALVVLNTSQLLYSHKYNEAKTLRSWSAMPRKSMAHDMVRIHEEENRVPGHRNAKEHIKTVFHEILCDSNRVAPNAEVYVIAIEDGTDNLLSVLSEDFDKYGTRITAMALVESIVDGAQHQNPKLKAFLNQRTRHWKYSDLTFDLLHCTQLPDGYNEDATQKQQKQSPNVAMQSTNHICWYENVPATETVPGVTKALHNITLDVIPSKQDTLQKDSTTSPEWSSGHVPLCPTFAGGSIATAECVFTTPAVQYAILTFFSEVAQDPANYRNPAFTIYTAAPQPTPENPLTLSPDDDFSALAAPEDQVTPEQSALDEARLKLHDLRTALAATSPDISLLQSGRERLAKKIKAQERLVSEMETAALAHGSLAAGEARQKRDENWKPQVEGPKVRFAGTMVDSELLKAVGLFDSAKGGGQAQEEGGEAEGDGEKAFL